MGRSTAASATFVTTAPICSRRYASRSKPADTMGSAERPRPDVYLWQYIAVAHLTGDLYRPVLARSRVFPRYDRAAVGVERKTRNTRHRGNEQPSLLVFQDA